MSSMAEPSLHKTFEPPLSASLGNVNVKSKTPILPQHAATTSLQKGDRGPRRHGLPSAVNFLLLTMAALVSVVVALLVLTYTTLARRQLPLPSIKTEVKGTLFLDHEQPIAGFFGQTFLRDNIPYIDIPDSLIQDVYYYRWTSLQRNLRYVTAGTGYICTEFVQPVGYAKAFGTIDAAAGHQIDEARWLRNTAYADDYIHVYTRGPADPLQYTQWILDAASRRAMVTGDSEFLSAQLRDMIRVWHLWDPFFDSAAGLYYYQPVWDAQELSLPGFVADPNGTDWTLRKDGPDTFRPSHNAYMVANARAIARAAKLAHDGFAEFQFLKVADEIETAMYKRMWAPEQEFFVRGLYGFPAAFYFATKSTVAYRYFLVSEVTDTVSLLQMDIIRPGNPNLTRLTGREQVGLFPYRFGIGLNYAYAQPALNSMFDPEGFLAPYGPTTLEIRDPWFAAVKPDPSYCCWWNGMSWPYSTGHTLKSLAAIYRSKATNATAEQYHQYLQMYARTQQKNGQPYVAESHYPFDDAWSADSYNHSENYDHSTNNDDVITGLLGILPQPDDTLRISPIVPNNWTYFALENLAYHGHLITILYDKDGSRYNVGPGLSVFVNGAKVHRGAGKSATVPIPPPILPDEAPVNIAANPVGAGHYPMANATFTYPADYSFKAIDGVVFYDNVPDNRWTNYLSPNMNDTLTVSFARPRNVSSITLALYSDIERSGGIDLPARIEIYGSSGFIMALNDSAVLLPNDRNEISFDTVETTFLAVNMYRRSATTYVGVCELEVWTAPAAGPTYFAVDAFLTGANTRVIFDNSSTATANGAVVGGVKSDSNVAFSGIKSDGEPMSLTLSYANLGNATVSVGVEVNQVPQTSLKLLPSNGEYVTVSADITLAVGKNYVSLSGGSDTVDVRLETLTIS
ncbi:Six-hairpin glycosidase [Xylariaceae sp. FL1651]|nr:Six-hairpin glycosidase [Xylariaceae sp. FL1651]